MSERRRRTRNSNWKHIAALGATLAVAGTGVGFMTEEHNVNVAKSRLITENTCLRAEPHQTVISRAVLECLENGVPGGSVVNDSDLKAGQPIDFVESAITHDQEASHFDWSQVAEWSAGVPVVVGAWLLFLG